MVLHCIVLYTNKLRITIVIVQYNDRSLPDNLLLTQAPIVVVWFDGNIIFLCFVMFGGSSWRLILVYRITVGFSPTLYC